MQSASTHTREVESEEAKSKNLGDVVEGLL
jgi:hypothetical protein